MTLNIELPDKKCLHLLKTPSGDVIISIEEKLAYNANKQNPTILATIPFKQRDSVADFFITLAK